MHVSYLTSAARLPPRCRLRLCTEAPQLPTRRKERYDWYRGSPNEHVESSWQTTRSRLVVEGSPTNAITRCAFKSHLFGITHTKIDAKRLERQSVAYRKYLDDVRPV